MSFNLFVYSCFADWFVYLCIYSCLYLFIHLCIHLFLHLFVFVFIYFCIHVFICMFIKIYVLYVYSAPRLVLPLCDVADGFVEDFLRRPLASVIASYLCGNCNYGDDIGVSPNEATQSQRG